MRSKIILLAVIMGAVMIYLSAFRNAGLWLIKNDEPMHADAMVILLGSVADRILQAVDLYQNGVAGKVIIAEGGMGAYRELKKRGADIISGTEQIRNAAVDLGIAYDSIILLQGNAQSTQQEALIVREYLSDEPGIDTLLLVSSSPHMRRAYIIFNNVFKKSRGHMCIICSPSCYTDFNPKKWWKSKDDIETVLTEYLKLANFVLFEKRNL